MTAGAIRHILLFMRLIYPMFYSMLFHSMDCHIVRIVYIRSMRSGVDERGELFVQVLWVPCPCEYV